MTNTNKGGGFRGRRRIIRDRRRSFSGRLDELIAALTEDFGDDPGPVELALIESAATLTVRAEELQEHLRRGENVNDNTLVRVSNAAARSLDQLSEAKKRRGNKPRVSPWKRKESDSEKA
jgi:hypothetical protein